MFVFLHHMVEYTLNNCPIFWDHLLPRDIWKAAPVEQEARRAIDPWEDVLRKYVANLDRVRTTELMAALQISVPSQTSIQFRRVKLIMTEQIGWKYGQVWQHGQNAMGYAKLDNPRSTA